MGEVEADYGGGGQGVRQRWRGELPLAGGFQGQVGEELAGGGIGQFGGRDGAVGIELYADVDADVAANGGAGFFGNYGKDFALDGWSGDGRRCGIYV